jgi:hypothetical protein
MRGPACCSLAVVRRQHDRWRDVGRRSDRVRPRRDDRESGTGVARIQAGSERGVTKSDACNSKCKMQNAKNGPMFRLLHFAF